MEKNFKLKLPKPQNFIIIDFGISESSIGIEQLSMLEIEEYAEMVKQDLINHWKSKKK